MCLRMYGICLETVYVDLFQTELYKRAELESCEM